MKVLITCPPMLGMMEEFTALLEEQGLRATCPPVRQTLSEAELERLVPAHEGWIIGDDPATARVFQAGLRGKLRAAVKWGIGVDNVDFAAAKALGLPIVNTPGMFGNEVADVAMAYVTGLARELFRIDRGVHAGEWPKFRGISLAGKTAALVGFGDIGRNIARRMRCAGMRVLAYDPAFAPGPQEEGVEVVPWPERIDEAEFIVFACGLSAANRHMFDARVVARVKPGLRVVNVARGPLIDEAALIEGLAGGRIHSAALDVFEDEPLPAESPLRRFEQCVFGAHNASNTDEAVRRTSRQAIARLAEFLGVA